jgi:hypothetical protein
LPACQQAGYFFYFLSLKREKLFGSPKQKSLIFRQEVFERRK